MTAINQLQRFIKDNLMFLIWQIVRGVVKKCFTTMAVTYL